MKLSQLRPTAYHARMNTTRLRNAPANTVRLQKALADAGIAARRDSERLITDGRIQGNGRTVTELPCFVDPSSDAVTMDGVPVDVTGSIGNAAAAGTPRKLIYVLVNKPKGVISTTDDELGRRNVLSLLPPAM